MPKGVTGKKQIQLMHFACRLGRHFWRLGILLHFGQAIASRLGDCLRDEISAYELLLDGIFWDR